MHVVCRDVESAKKLLQWGIASGFRESGVVLGNRKIVCAIRTTANGFEIPLGRSAEHLLVNDEYLRWIVNIANQKFEANKQKTDRLFEAFRGGFCNPLVVSQAESGCLVELSSWTEVARKESVQLVGHASVRYRDLIVVFGGQGPTTAGLTTRVATVTILAPSKEGSLLQTYHATAGANGPSPRMYHSCSVVGTRMVVFGGRASPVKPLGDLYGMDLETKQWETIATQGVGPSPRWKHCSCAGEYRLPVCLAEQHLQGLTRFLMWLHTVGSVVYVYGGRDAQHVFGDMFALDLNQKPPQWRQIGTPRFHSSAVITCTDYLVCCM